MGLLILNKPENIKFIYYLMVRLPSIKIKMRLKQQKEEPKLKK